MKARNAGHVERAIGLAEEMKRLADEAEASCDDDCCLLVYGYIRDCAYEILSVIQCNCLEIEDDYQEDSLSLAVGAT